MPTALKVRSPALPLPAIPVPVDPLSLLPDHARIKAERRLAVIRPALIRVQQGASPMAAAEWLVAVSPEAPSAVSVYRWLKAYLTGGIVELAPDYKGRQRKERGWEARAAELYNQPQKPAYATVAYWLRKEGFADASEHNVRRYLKALPSNLTETGKKRLGAHYYAQSIKPHKVRDNTVLPVGFVYEGDGHCCDVYVAHPATGRAFRPELTTWIDIRSHYLVSWWISESESAHTTLFSLSQALVAHNHTPAYVHTDPGSGFKAKLISDEVTGFLVRFAIEPMLALPGNAKGKGLQEGWFRWFEERLGKRFDTYCGHDRTDDFLRHLSEKVKRGIIVLPTLQQYIDAVRDYVETYNNTPQDGLGGKTPAEIWAALERVELHTPAEAIIRPRIQRTVQRWGITLDKRKYRAAALAQYEGREVIVEYSIHTDDRVWVHDLKGRYLCDAQLVEKTPWLPDSRIEQAQQKRLEGQRQRHLKPGRACRCPPPRCSMRSNRTRRRSSSTPTCCSSATASLRARSPRSLQCPRARLTPRSCSSCARCSTRSQTWRRRPSSASCAGCSCARSSRPAARSRPTLPAGTAAIRTAPSGRAWPTSTNRSATCRAPPLHPQHTHRSPETCAARSSP
jgi:putative transposase